MPGREAYRVEGWCPCAEAPPRSDDEYFEALTAAVFQMRFRPAIVRARWPSIRAAFAGFSLATVASWSDAEVECLLGCPGMIRNRKKILATLRSARQLAEHAHRQNPNGILVHFHCPAESISILLTSPDTKR